MQLVVGLQKGVTLPNLIVGGGGGLLSRRVGILLHIYRFGGDNK